jgi:translation initiation factor 1 (eIF-1/SUI1)
MVTRARFAALLLIFAILPSRWLLPQEAAAKKPTENPAPEQTTESNARFSRTHCDVPSCVQKVLYFSNISQPADMQDVVNAMRAIAEIQRVQQILGAQIIIIEGTAEQVAMAEKLAAEIDKDKRRFGGLGYRIDLKIQESGGDNKLHSRVYSLVTEARQTARVSIGRQAPAQVPNEPASETKKPSDSSNAPNIECRILAENERTVELSVETEIARDASHELGGASPPLLRTREHVTVQLDKPTVISRIDDPDGNSSITIELTATRIKER